MINKDVEKALGLLQKDIAKGFEDSSTLHLSFCSAVPAQYRSVPFNLLAEYYKDQREKKYVTCELTFLMWYKNKYGGNEDENIILYL